MLCKIEKLKPEQSFIIALKVSRKNKETTIASQLAQSVLHNNSKIFWCEIKKAKCNLKKDPSTVDSAVGCDNICDVFCENYKNLYNSVSYDVNEMVSLKNQIHTNVKEICNKGECYSDHTISVQNVLSVRHLK